MSRHPLRIALVWLALSAGSVCAVEKPAAVRPATPEISGGLLLETFLGLLLVVGLIFALGWFMKRFGRLPSGGKGSSINILGGVSLGPRERAVLLEVDQVRLLVGVAPGRVSTLHVLGERGAETTQDEAFSERLDQALEGEGSR